MKAMGVTVAYGVGVLVVVTIKCVVCKGAKCIAPLIDFDEDCSETGCSYDWGFLVRLDDSGDFFRINLDGAKVDYWGPKYDWISDDHTHPCPQSGTDSCSLIAKIVCDGLGGPNIFNGALECQHCTGGLGGD